MSVQRHIIADPYPETIGLSALTIFAPADFRGDVEIIWWYPSKSADADRQRITCSATALLQGVFRDVRGTLPGEQFDTRGGARPGEQFDARVVALVLHAFYRARIEAVAQLEAAYEWKPYAQEDLSPPSPEPRDRVKRGLGKIMDLIWQAHHHDAVLSKERWEHASRAASTLRQTLEKLESAHVAPIKEELHSLLGNPEIARCSVCGAWMILDADIARGRHPEHGAQ